MAECQYKQDGSVQQGFQRSLRLGRIDRIARQSLKRLELVDPIGEKQGVKDESCMTNFTELSSVRAQRWEILDVQRRCGRGLAPLRQHE